jgi:cytochrome c oxidase assembly protein subunit 15
VLVALLGLAVVVVGTVVTATGPHAGDENAIRFGLDLTVVVRVHAIAVWIFLAALVASAVLVRKASAQHLVRPLEIVIGWTLAQGLVGYVQYFSGVPVFLVAIHVAGSVFVWMAVMRYVLQVLKPVH